MRRSNQLTYKYKDQEMENRQLKERILIKKKLLTLDKVRSKASDTEMKIHKFLYLILEKRYSEGEEDILNIKDLPETDMKSYQLILDFFDDFKFFTNNPKSFLKKSLNERKEIVRNMAAYLGPDVHKKFFFKNSVVLQDEIKEKLPKQLAVFNNLFNKHIVEGSTNKHVNRKYMKFKLKAFYQNIMEYVTEEHFPFIDFLGEQKYKITDVDIDSLIGSLKSEEIFSSLVFFCTIQPLENAFTLEDLNSTVVTKDTTDLTSLIDTKSSKKNLKKEDELLFIKKYEVRYHFCEILITQLIYSLIKYLNDSGKIKISEEFTDLEEEFTDLESFIQDWVQNNNIKLDKRSWYNDIHSIAMTILSLFEQSGVVYLLKPLQRKNNSKEEVLLYLISDNVLKLRSPLMSYIPQIIEPICLITNSDALKTVKKIPFGTVDITFSEDTIKALNISQGKKHRVNPIFTHITNEMNNTKEWPPFFFSDELYPTSEGSFKMKKNLSKKSRSSKTRFFFLSDNIKAARNKRNTFLSFLAIAKNLYNFPLYFGNLLDFRLRMYPYQPFLSRITGSYKHFLMDYKGFVLTRSGLINLIRAFANASSEYLEKFEQCLSNIKYPKDTVQELKRFNETTECNFLKVHKKADFFCMLKANINLSFLERLTNKVHLNLELDQSASSLVITSLLFKNKALALVSNLLQKNKQDIYSYIGSHVKKFLLGKKYYKRIKKSKKQVRKFQGPPRVITEANGSTVFQFFEKKKPIKYASMCFFYNQTPHGRLKDWKEEWFNIFEREPNNDEFSILIFFSNKYGEFLDSLFPNLLKQLKIINEIVKLVVRKNYAPVIKTLDGSVIKWNFYKSTRKNRYHYNPISDKQRSYSLRVFKLDKNSNPIIDISRHLTSFFPNFIHSIDAGIMRTFINLMHDKTKYTIGHIHDCVLLHPNYVDDFYEVVSELYTSEKMHNLAKDLFFDPIKSSVDEETKGIIEKHEEEFFKLASDFKVTKENFEPRNMYTFEN